MDAPAEDQVAAASPEGLAPAGPDGVLRQLWDARQRLVETGSRNRLIHTPRRVKRARALDIVAASSLDVFRLLVRNGRRMRFAADPEADLRLQGEMALAAPPEPDDEAAAGSGSELVLQTLHGSDALEAKLAALAREARTIEEEQGINALYLALGFLSWFEDERSEVARQAPLVLVPVTLRRNECSALYELEARPDDIVSNEPLLQRLKGDFGIRLPEIPEGDDWLPDDYCAAVAEAVAGRPRWSVEPDGMLLGFFSFARLLMVKDLEPESWPGGTLTGHPLLAGLLEQGFAAEAPLFAPAPQLDALFEPADLVQVVDADASQTLVIETVRRGRNLVVQGPPGTGKSQTITNIIAAAVHDGRSVLFVAEKMAALDVVHARLKAAGLRDICLELHSRSANKRAVIEELGRTLASAPGDGATDDVAALTVLRDQLNAIAETMHTPVGESGTTPHRALSTLIRLSEAGVEPPALEIAGLEHWTPAQLAAALDAAGRSARAVAEGGAAMRHPLLGIGQTELLPPERQRLEPRLGELRTALDEAEKATALVAGRLGLSGPASLALCDACIAAVRQVAQLPDAAVPFVAAILARDGLAAAREVLAAGTAYRAALAEGGEVFTPAALRASIGHLRGMLVSGRSFFGRFGSAYRDGSAELATLLRGPLPRKQPERLQLLDRLDALQQGYLQLTRVEAQAQAVLPVLWRGAETDFAALGAACGWLDEVAAMDVSADVSALLALRKHTPEQLETLCQHLSVRAGAVRGLAADLLATLAVDLDGLFGVGALDAVPFAALAGRVGSWIGGLARYDEWAQLVRCDRRLRETAGPELADAVAAGEIAPLAIAVTLRYLHAEAIYRRFAAGASWAIHLTAAEKAEMIAEFRAREGARRRTAAQLIRARHLAELPQGGMGAMGLIRSEIGKKRGHRSIRRLMSEAGPVVQQIKPVLLMSPISVAQFLPPGRLDFDLLVIDEASQVRPEDALGAIARARQIVVVGDRRQLPPTSFFDRVIGDEEETEPDEEESTLPPRPSKVTELESILTLCEARGLDGRMLKWHYRSRHPSLIAVSNQEFYRGELVLFPAPGAAEGEDGLLLRPVRGAYDRGGRRINTIEAEAVARAVAEHARRWPARSLGVVTFSTAQRDEVTLALDRLRLGDPVLSDFMREGRPEALFVKSIETVQGDERDAIMISVGYGPRIAGHPLDSMAFGPVSSEGGERRLNVLFTRARFRTEVFVSFAPGDIDLSRTRSEGARVLKRFLSFAETGQAELARPTGAEPDSEFEVSVAEELRRLGYRVDHQVGSAGFRIDLAVRHPERPGRYMLAVECDGASYHSALWARERDRLRQQVLEGLGWRVHRVWSTDWFHRREAEVARLRQALDAAQQIEEPDDAPLEPAAADAGEAAEEVLLDGALPGDTGLPRLPDYQVANFEVAQRGEPHEQPMSVLAPLLAAIIAVEGPVHRDEIARRVASLFGKHKAGARIVAKVDSVLAFMGAGEVGIAEADGFWSTEAQRAAVPLRNRSRVSVPTLRKAGYLPPDEIAAAIRLVLAHNGAMSWEETPRAVALLFGFQRTGPEFRPTIVPIMEAMLADGRIRETAAGLLQVVD